MYRQSRRLAGRKNVLCPSKKTGNIQHLSFTPFSLPFSLSRGLKVEFSTAQGVTYQQTKWRRNTLLMTVALTGDFQPTLGIRSKRRLFCVGLTSRMRTCTHTHTGKQNENAPVDGVVLPPPALLNTQIPPFVLRQKPRFRHLLRLLLREHHMPVRSQFSTQ